MDENPHQDTAPQAYNPSKDVGIQTKTSDTESIAPVDPLHDIARVIDHKAERALCRKFDFRLLPVLAFMYLCNALDKGNLGNAETDGLSDGKKRKQIGLMVRID
ncbi:hypothetical protein VTN77DRAFT_1926 [Rasamsonia byssochlamydoides]|uniref:uncharacterized protein n=1 Tax=Rasamsonia byssochlamydoides TaxID=89139 RepID=UPI0037436450